MELLLTTIRRFAYDWRATIGRATPTRAIYTHENRLFQRSLIGSRWRHVTRWLAHPGPQDSSFPMAVHYADDVVPDRWHDSLILFYTIILNLSAIVYDYRNAQERKFFYNVWNKTNFCRILKFVLHYVRCQAGTTCICVNCTIYGPHLSRHDRIVFSGVSFFGRTATRRGNAHKSNSGDDRWIDEFLFLLDYFSLFRRLGSAWNVSWSDYSSLYLNSFCTHV